MRAISLKRQRINRQRRRMVAALIEARPWCGRCGKATRELDPHEILSRARGGSIIDPANVALLCRPCHGYITAHPEIAAATGWATSAGDVIEAQMGEADDWHERRELARDALEDGAL